MRREANGARGGRRWLKMRESSNALGRLGLIKQQFWDVLISKAQHRRST